LIWLADRALLVALPPMATITQELTMKTKIAAKAIAKKQAGSLANRPEKANGAKTSAVVRSKKARPESTRHKTSLGKPARTSSAMLPAVATPRLKPADTATQPGPKADSRSAPAPAPRDGSKIAQVVAALETDHGATIAELSKLTGWQPHSVRGVISAVLKRRMGLAIRSEKTPGALSAYRIQRESPAGRV